MQLLLLIQTRTQTQTQTNQHQVLVENAPQGAFFVMQHQNFKTNISFAAIVGLTACSGFNPVTDTAGYFFQSGVSSLEKTYVPGFEYLEVEWLGRKSVMALGYRSVSGTHTDEHWYTNQGEMLKLQNGRIAQVLGMTRELRRLSNNSPSWTDLTSRKLPVGWSQTKDVMPGYRFGLQEFVITQQVDPTSTEQSLSKVATHWIAEEIKSKDASGKTWIYKQKFALANNQVVYSEQCVAQDMCFKLRPLGVVMPK